MSEFPFDEIDASKVLTGQAAIDFLRRIGFPVDDIPEDSEIILGTSQNGVPVDAHQVVAALDAEEEELAKKYYSPTQPFFGEFVTLNEDGNFSLADSADIGPVSTMSQEEREKAETGLRFNEGKIRYDLLPMDVIEALAQHYTVGAKKYADRNWEKGFSWMSCFASLMRHLALWAAGEDYDVGPNGEWGPYPDQPEIDMKWTGALHATCVLWNAAALTAFALRGVGTDDRQKRLPNPKPVTRPGI